MAWGRLALLQAADDEHALSTLADLFGYTRLPDDDIQIRDQSGLFQTATEINVKQDGATTPKRPPARFLRINKVVNTESDRDDFLKPAYLSDPDMRLPASSGTYRFAAPVQLMPMARLLPLLFNSLAQARTGHGLDHRQLIKRLAQGKALQRLPTRQHHRWPQGLQIIVDASPRLEPYWTDFERIVRQLQSLLGKEAVQALRFDEDTLGSDASYCLAWPDADNDHWRLWQIPPPDVAVLVLSDLGFGDNRATVAWRRQLQALQQHPSPMLTLSPASATPDDKLFCQQFKPNAFNDYQPLPRHPVRTGFSLRPSPSAYAIEDILTWLAPLPLIDSGLLRRLRVAMQWGDSALEAVVWNHPAVRNIGLGICLQTQEAKYYQLRFQTNYAGSKQAELFWGIVEDHHAGAYPGLRQLEEFKLSLLEQKDLPAMREYFQRLCATGMQGGSDPAQQRALRRQCRTVLDAMPDTLWDSTLKDLAYPLYATAHEDEIRAGRWPEQLPPGFNPDHLRWVVGETNGVDNKQVWQIVQIGDQGQMTIGPCSMEKGWFVPVFKTEVAQEFPPRLTLSDAQGQVTHSLQTGMTVSLSDNAKAVLAISGVKLELEAITRPSWASRIWQNADGLWVALPWLDQVFDVFWQPSKTEASGRWLLPTPFGEDVYGLYVDLSVNKVTQRFRWLAPGTFWMGSPDGEPEREWNGMEGGKGTETRHQVTLTQGYWMADTTVTQAFWQAVMGDNPSQFKDHPENPVEQVSWQDAQAFIDKLNSLFPGLQARLPSDAQWEYACRAGTDTPFSFGTNITPEQANYDGSQPYANGKQGLYRQRTVPVKSLPANDWGLYEMHGNVWEWCADGWQQKLSAEPVTDPFYMAAVGFARVVRGGSWHSLGRCVRSANRSRYTLDSRNSYLGFRLALGHVGLRPGQGVATGAGTGRRVAEQRQTVPAPIADGGMASDVAKRIKKLFGKSKKKK
ncbi:MAG: formylglycine-generating enzyme family protein [Methylococcales bacterium]|nr:formylglycine-generating enzyme family protein [Methylococcales bacterium]